MRPLDERACDVIVSKVVISASSGRRGDVFERFEGMCVTRLGYNLKMTRDD